MRAVAVRCEVVPVRALLHSVFAVPPSVAAAVVTQWIEALWHRGSEEVVRIKRCELHPNISLVLLARRWITHNLPSNSPPQHL